MRNPYPKWREELVLFLDDAFDCLDAYQALTAAGLNVVRFSDSFKDRSGKRLASVKDPAVIDHCDRHGYILVTSDAQIINMHRTDIQRASQVAILATAHNSVSDIHVWVEALIQVMPELQKNNQRKRERPWFAKFDTRGRFSVPPQTLRSK